MAVVANEAETAGTAAGAVVARLLPVPTTDGVRLVMSFTSAMPTF